MGNVETVLWYCFCLYTAMSETMTNGEYCNGNDSRNSPVAPDLTPPATPAEAAQQLPAIHQEDQTHSRGFLRGYGCCSPALARFCCSA